MTRQTVPALRACGNCGGSFPPALITQNWCPRCLANDPKRARRAATGAWSENRDSAVQARFRKRLMERSGGQCEFMIMGFARCWETAGLQAHHTGPDEGLMLCYQHHRQLDDHARRT